MKFFHRMNKLPKHDKFFVDGAIYEKPDGYVPSEVMALSPEDFRRWNSEQLALDNKYCGITTKGIFYGHNRHFKRALTYADRTKPGRSLEELGY